jgi:nitroreductase
MGPNPFAPPETPNRHALFDTGMAAIQFVLEGERHGLRSHFLGGIDPAAAHALLGLAADEEVVCAIVVGHPADPASLPEGLRQRERPSGRKPAGEIATFA